MRSRKFDDKPKSKSKKTVFVTVLLIVIIISGIYFGYLASGALTDNIYEGIYVGKTHIGNLSKADALSKLKEAYPLEEINVSLECAGKKVDVYGPQINLAPDFEATVDEAAAYGKGGSIFSKIKKMKEFSSNPEKLSLKFKCDIDALQYLINESLSDKITDVQGYSVEIGENSITVFNGKSGVVADAVEILDLISDAVTGKKENQPISFTLKNKEPEKINPESFFEIYNREVKDSECIQEGDNLKIIPEIIGIKLDKEETFRILKENESNSSPYEIPAKITQPKVTSAQLEAEYTDTVIATYSTSYSSSSANRKENIRLASSKIDGLILNPGEVFSFNEVVGPRTEATGFKIAHVYSGSKVVDGIGGGICQVSSTLYNAVVFADLEIVFRRNHSLPVSYVPLGRDATVSYGTIDFKFKNNKSTPIKFEVISDGSTLTVNVYGRKKYIKDISIETAVTGTIPFSETVIKDDTLSENERVIVEKGANGTKVEAYKIVKENGEVVSRTLLAKSSYNPTTQTVKEGTKKPEPEIPSVDKTQPGNEINSGDEIRTEPPAQPDEAVSGIPDNTQVSDNDEAIVNDETLPEPAV